MISILIISSLVLLISIIYLISKYNLERTQFVQGVFRNNKVEIRNSPIHGRGVYALQDFKKGDIIEYAPLIKADCTNIPKELKDYYLHVKGNVCGYGMGYFNYYNDSKNPNAFFQASETDSSVYIIASKDIKKGEEIFNSYGASYWAARGIDRNKL